MIRTILWLVPTTAILIVFYLASSQEQSIDIPAQNLTENSAVKIIKKTEPTTTIPDILKDEPEIGRIYKWRDPNGTIIISSEPPKLGTKAEIFPFQLQQELETQKYTANNSNSAAPDPSKPVQAGQPSFVNTPLHVYTPEGLRELIRYSKEIGEKIETRGELLNEMIKQM